MRPARENKVKLKLSTPEEVIQNFIRNRKNEGRIFLFTFFAGILNYIRMIVQWLANPDSVWEGLIYKNIYSWEASLGRFGLEYAAVLKRYFVLPALQTIFSLLLVACIAVILYELFEMKSWFWGCMAGALLVCSPSLCSTLTYYFTADAYIFAWLLSVLFVWILAKYKRTGGFICAVLCMGVSLSLYQAYVGTAVTLCLLYLLFMLLIKDTTWKTVLLCACRYLAAGVTSILLYLGVFKIYCLRTGTIPNTDRGFGSLGNFLEELGTSVGNAYKGFYQYFLTDDLYSNSWYLRGEVNLLLLLLLLVIVAVIIIQKKIYKEAGRLVCTVAFLVLVPVAFMSIGFMPGANIHGVTGILMLPHMNFLFLFILVLASAYTGKLYAKVILQWAAAGLCTTSVFILILYTQVFQSCKEMDLHRTYTLAQQITARVEELPEYQSGIPLMVGGRAENGNFPKQYEEMYYVTQGTAVSYGYMWSSGNGQQNCWINFLRQYVGMEYSTCSNDVLEEITASQEYKDMPIFPAQGSVRFINGCAVVKLSN